MKSLSLSAGRRVVSDSSVSQIYFELVSIFEK